MFVSPALIIVVLQARPTPCGTHGLSSVYTEILNCAVYFRNRIPLSKLVGNFEISNLAAQFSNCVNLQIARNIYISKNYIYIYTYTYTYTENTPSTQTYHQCSNNLTTLIISHHRKTSIILLCVYFCFVNWPLSHHMGFLIVSPRKNWMPSTVI